MRTTALVFITSLLCLAYLPPLSAQTKTEVLQDSILLTPQKDIRVIIIGKELKTLVNYKRTDSILQLFLSDFEKALQQGLSETTKVTHYLVHPSGKRRFKAENEDYQEAAFSLQDESAKLNLQLPALAYYIYDLEKATQIQIFSASTVALQSLKDHKLSEALSNGSITKSQLKKNSSIVLQKSNTSWQNITSRKNPKDYIELNPLFGISTIGSQLSPEVGIRLSLVPSNKYGRANWTLGLSYNINLITEFAAGDYISITSFRSINTFFMKHGRGEGDGLWKWLGVQVGYIHLSPGLLNNSSKIGIITQYRGVHIGFHSYFLSKPIKANQNVQTVLYGASILF